ncbi:MAG: glycosyltransferase family 39 protein [Patescibacteria group bacterium]
MFLFALLLGLYSYLIFFLGLTGLLYQEIIVWMTLIFWGGILLLYRKSFFASLKNLKNVLHKMLKHLQHDKTMFLLLLLFVIQALVNLIGVFGPELAFDALWYHLTLPKLYLQEHTISFLPGGLLYYSAMPKLAEMLYVAGLSFGNEITVKLIHFSFGLLTCFALYLFTRKFYSPLISLIAVVIFYSNFVVAWESITAYVDLVRAFFEIMALWAVINWWEGDKRKWLILSAILLGFAITTKLLAMGSILIFLLLIFLKREAVVKKFQSMFFYLSFALLIPLPWFIFTYLHTGNPVYPFFSDIYSITPEPVSLQNFLQEVWIVFTHASDRLSPLYVMLSPLLVFCFGKMKREIKIIAMYSLCAIIVWYFTPRTGGGRFILPYLPAFSLLCVFILDYFMSNTKKYGKFFSNFLIGVIIFVSLFTICYRFAANMKYISVIIGKESKEAFLTRQLNFAFADFYDTDGYFKKHLTSKDRVLLYGFHNLYYVDFPFVDASWRRKEDIFNYIATQKADLPKEYADWRLIYHNERTMVKLYKKK